MSLLSDTVVHARQLTKRFGEFTAVDGIDFSISRGEFFGFLGPNGAGKTSTMRMVACMSPRSGGELVVRGMDPAHDGPEIRAGIGLVPQEDALDTELTVLDNLLLYGRYFGLPRKVVRERSLALLAFAQLEDRAGAKVDALSGGMRRRLVIARALISRPDLVILDEPTTGLDPQARILVWTKIRELRSLGVTILLTTHYMDEAERLADHLVVMDRGTVLERGTPPDLIHRVVGDDCLEIPALERDTKDRISRSLNERPVWMDYQAGSLLIYGKDMDQVIEQLRDLRLLPRTYYRRRASLEDVFLK